MQTIYRTHIISWLGWLLIFEGNGQVAANPSQPPSITMNRAETELIETLKTACKALAFEANNPPAIAAKFGKVIK